ncbi:Hypothetical protein ORPV_286 [Orpheovirus IHUMI-LCC2]|uniref:Uncharacterized protein n=1 Tax=Orpheovirus IHUMI-LCC2 TaxID=2023057 RepID=A0A2I2L3U6_9VIRU|nr:Hypothetical protein ORPV_286 [Orpheovirus IHUMI-LCC2]SNW62190.1 Hypothetical protein ORPV_286 [Orpheovirus IHUMI-LCC2]
MEEVFGNRKSLFSFKFVRHALLDFKGFKSFVSTKINNKEENFSLLSCAELNDKLINLHKNNPKSSGSFEVTLFPRITPDHIEGCIFLSKYFNNFKLSYSYKNSNEFFDDSSNDMQELDFNYKFQ